MKGIHSIRKVISDLSVKTSLKKKIKLVFFLLLILPLLLFTGISYVLTNRLILNQNLHSMSQTFDTSMNVFKRYFGSMSEAMNNILTDREVYEAILGSTENNTVFEQQVYYNTLSKKFEYIQKISDVDYIRIYVKSRKLYTENKIDFFSLSEVKDSEWYQNFQKINQSRMWVEPGYIKEADGTNSIYFSYLGMIYDPDKLKAPLGMLRIDIEKEKIESILKELKFSPKVSVFLTNREEMIFSLPGDIQEFRFSELSGGNKNLGQHQWEFLKYGQAPYIVRSKEIAKTGWYLLVMVPKEYMFQTQEILYRTLIIGLLVIAVLSYLLAYGITHSSLKRIFLLNKEMKRVESGDLALTLRPEGKDEIGELMESFQAMTLRMEKMINERYQMGQEVKNAELNALQAQINPHFLYNSLDLVNCLAIEHDVPEIAEMITSLVDFYKLTLNRGKEIVSIADELFHVRTYVKIQNMRFEKAIQLTIDEAEWHKQFAILKIILQPLIENSIMHGILEKEESSGKIIIKVEQQKDTILIHISDDGVGMPKEQLNMVFTEEKVRLGSGYGVKNINERLALYYGAEYGLQFSSVEGKGTTVTVRIPAIRYNPN